MTFDHAYFGVLDLDLSGRLRLDLLPRGFRRLLGIEDNVTHARVVLAAPVAAYETGGLGNPRDRSSSSSCRAASRSSMVTLTTSACIAPPPVLAGLREPTTRIADGWEEGGQAYECVSGTPELTRYTHEVFF